MGGAGVVASIGFSGDASRCGGFGSTEAACVSRGVGRVSSSGAECSDTDDDWDARLVCCVERGVKSWLLDFSSSNESGTVEGNSSVGIDMSSVLTITDLLS